MAKFAWANGNDVGTYWCLVSWSITQIFHHGEVNNATLDGQAAAERNEKPETSGSSSRRRSEKIRKQQRSWVENEAIEAGHLTEDKILKVC